MSARLRSFSVPLFHGASFFTGFRVTIQKSTTAVAFLDCVRAVAASEPAVPGRPVVDGLGLGSVTLCPGSSLMSAVAGLECGDVDVFIGIVSIGLM